MIRAYYGEDLTRYPSLSAVAGLVAATVPMLFAVSELESPLYHRQVATVLDAVLAGAGRVPLVVTIPDHTHLSGIMALGLDDEAFGLTLARFVHRCGSNAACRSGVTGAQ